MRFGWVAVVVLLMSACGSTPGESDDLPEPPTAPTTPLPAFDPATKDDAQKVLERALSGAVRAEDISFESDFDLFDVSLSLEGHVDVGREASEFALHVSGDALADRAGGDTAFEYRIRGTHVYGSPNFGPFDKCWFDYGDANPMFAGNDAPWLHVAIAAVSDSRALGFSDEEPDVVVVEIPAIELLSITSAKLAKAVALELPEDVIYSRAAVEVRGDKYSSLRFNVDEALTALQDGGVDLVAAFAALPETQGGGEPPAGAQSELKAYLRKYLSFTQTVEYSYRKSVPVGVPPADQLMDASDLTDPQNPPDRQPDLCAAAD